MRAELPWNVAGIPPEAREAARAAARREGLSVGEWLTRRILRSFSDMGEEAAPNPYDHSYERAAMDRGALDPWGLPPSPASRRDTEEMLSRVSRSEAESSESYRRIEEHLRTVSRRLDSAERSQSENNRTMNKTASEISIATREQAQAFDQLGSHVVNIGDRLERLERATQQDGLRDAVKALHQGLSRLADQITQAASQSAAQVSVMTDNLKELATRLAQVRGDAEAATNRLEARVAEMEEEARGRFTVFQAELGRNLDQRLGAAEKAAQSNSHALDHALERLEAQSGIRAGDQAELQRRHAETDGSISRQEEALDRLQAAHAGTDGSISRLEEALERLQAAHVETGGSISRLEENMERLQTAQADPSLERRLDSFERALGSLVSRIESYDPAAPLEETLRDITRRIDTVEKNNSALLNELRANLADGAKPVLAGLEPSFDPALFAGQDDFIAPEAGIEAPPFAASPASFDDDAFDPQTAFPSEPPPEDRDPFAADAFSTEALAPPVEISADQAAADENFLAAARRSVRAANEAEAARHSPFNFSSRSTGEESPRRYLLAAAIAGIIILALAGGILLSQKLRHGGNASQPGVPVSKPVRNNAPFTPVPENLPASHGAPAPGNARPVQPAPQGPAPAPAGQPQAVQPGQPQAAQTPPAAPKNPLPTLDRVTQLANGGNAGAQTIIGLKELDGDGVPANPADAAKWLERAAGQGQAVAQYRLGTVYERGQGVAANPAIATHWYQLAATQGNRKAMHNLAVAYASGVAGKKDMAEAARWFAKAASLGLADSQFNLAVLYERGDGVPQSLLDAYKWYAIAATDGDAESKTRMGVLATQLSDDDRSAAQKSAAAFHAAPLSHSANVPPEMADLSGVN